MIGEEDFTFNNEEIKEKAELERFEDEMAAFARECETEEQIAEDKAIHEDEDAQLRELEFGEDF